MASSEFPLHLLQSADQVQLLNDIDKLRSDGVQYHDISLPQLVVCGDQSSGKSSALEALSNVKFPIDKGTYTRFAMEIALRRSPDKKATAKILPGKNPLANRQQRLADFQPSDVGLAGVPELIERARGAMGLSEDHAICDDVLRLEITGPDLPHLTLVDLPGLIADAKDTKDIELVESMVETYMENKRSIILKIMSTQNDKQNQKVLRLARKWDPHGDRTVGIITKPDTLKNYRGSVAERSYLEMAKNQDPISKLRLGWHVVRNPDYHEKQKDSTYNRDEKEREIFSQEPWNELFKWQLGIGSLRDELMKHLFNQIRSELPRVVEDIEREETKCEQEIKDLGEVRTTRKDQEKYLIGISGRFGQLVGAGLEGHWTSDHIFNVETMRLRAQIRNLNDVFERAMITKGHTFEISPASSQR
jgi:GTPase SAR1 family protein